MDDNGHGGPLAWAIDVAAATVLGAAVCVAGGWLGVGAWGLVAGAVAVGMGLLTLRSLPPEPRSFPTSFRIPLDWSDGIFAEQETSYVGELMLELEDRLAEPSIPLRIVPNTPSIPTAHELLTRIETHLGVEHIAVSDSPSTVHVVPLQADASAALRSALQDLRRSIG